MDADEQAIRKLVEHWHESTALGDVDAILPLTTEDVVFLVAGQAPFGRTAFEQGLRSMLQTHRVESSWEIMELRISGGMAYCLSHLEVRVFARSGGTPTVRRGHSLSVLRKDPSGAWRIARDANLLAASSDA